MEIKHLETPVAYNVVQETIKEIGIKNIGKASIRELVRLINVIEQKTGIKFVRMEMGVPGLPVSDIAVEAEYNALKRGVASVYPMIEGVDELKKEFSRFLKLFANITIPPECCIPTVGSMQGAFAAFMIVSKAYENKNITLFIDPGFPVQKQQHQVLDIPYVTFDVYNYRGNKLKDKILEILESNNYKISCIVYSNPNNPAWICFTDDELKIIGDIANEYDIIVVEDLAYFAMDFRKDLSHPGMPPYQPSVANYTSNYILLVSSSKMFSYAGQRIGIIAVSPTLFNRSFDNLLRKFGNEKFGYNLIYKIIYSLSAGVAHSVQYGLAALLKAVNDGNYNFVQDVKEYGRRANIMKKIFTDNGFYIVYDKDIDVPIADGFYFTFGYPGFTSEELLERLLYYGVSAISLSITGSERKDGMRACVSQVSDEMIAELEKRLKLFNQHHSG
ncbi:MAG: pyridoxal phosphate-dependent aminotransferase [Bacteroidales bacterium]|nr:pyridoxal phosphate-dependent aminotransferase [Bacteroidales bacterium]